VKAQVKSAANIAKNPLQGSQVSVSRSMHVEADLLNGIGDARRS
jgi:hypothetical protein